MGSIESLFMVCVQFLHLLFWFFLLIFLLSQVSPSMSALFTHCYWYLHERQYNAANTVKDCRVEMKIVNVQITNKFIPMTFIIGNHLATIVLFPSWRPVTFFVDCHRTRCGSVAKASVKIWPCSFPNVLTKVPRENRTTLFEAVSRNFATSSSILKVW